MRSLRHARHAVLAGLLTILTLPGCASPSGGNGGGGQRDFLSSEELRESDTGSHTLQQVIERLRPHWLRRRSSTMMGQELLPVVYMDGSRIGSVEVLRTIAAQDVGEVRYLSSSDATTRYGTGHAGGVIVIRSRR